MQSTIPLVKKFFDGEGDICAGGQINREITTFRDYYECLVPACLIIYDIIAYFQPNGDLRLIIDHNPRYRYDHLDLKYSMDGISLLPEGYTFVGWYTDSACTKAYDFSTSVTSDLTLYALWKATEVKVPTSGTYLMGDVDFDGRIDSGDALFVLRASVGLETVNDTLFKFADVDGDNKITAADSLDILRYSVNLSVNSNVGVKTEI